MRALFYIALALARSNELALARSIDSLPGFCFTEIQCTTGGNPQIQPNAGCICKLFVLSYKGFFRVWVLVSCIPLNIIMLTHDTSQS